MVKFTLRVPDYLMDKVKKLAANEGKSVNQYIQERIEAREKDTKGRDENA